MGVAEADMFVGIGSMAWMFRMSAEKQEGAEPEPTAEVAVSHASEDTSAAEKEGARTTTRLPTPPAESEIEAHLWEKYPVSRKETLLGRKKKEPRSSLKEAEEGRGQACSIKRSVTITRKLQEPGQALPGQFPAFFAEHAGVDTPPGSPTRIFAQAGTQDMPSVEESLTAGKADPTLEYSSLLIAKPLPFKFNMQIRDRKKAEYVAREWMNLKMDGELTDSKCYWEGGNQGNATYGWGEVHK